MHVSNKSASQAAKAQTLSGPEDTACSHRTLRSHEGSRYKVRNGLIHPKPALKRSESLVLCSISTELRVNYHACQRQNKKCSKDAQQSRMRPTHYSLKPPRL